MMSAASQALQKYSNGAPYVRSTRSNVGPLAAKCRFCESADVKQTFEVSEMMLGMGNQFQYFECAECGSFNIVDSPVQLSRFYPPNYYSFPASRETSVKRRLKQLRGLFDTGEWPRALDSVCPIWSKPHYAEWVERTGVLKTSSILDVGCGAGLLIGELRDAGFQNLLGIDPYLPEDMAVRGMPLRKLQIEEVKGRFDLIMFHHSLEHMRAPIETLNFVKAHLESGGKVLIRLPIAGSWASTRYGSHWVQLDAPRHLGIPSLYGMQCLAEKAGFRVIGHYFDSHGLQFYGSEMYRRGIPLRSCRPQDLFSRRQLRAFERRSRVLNGRGEGDAACFILSS